MISIISKNNITFKSNRADSVRRVGRFFEQQVNTGAVKSVKTDYLDKLGARVSCAESRPYVMGVTGYTGAGKSFLNGKMKEVAPEQITVVTGDCLYRDLSPEFAKVRTTPDGRKVTGFEGMVYGGWCFEGPHNFDIVKGAGKIELYKSGQPVKFDKYLMDNTGRVEPDSIDVASTPLMLFDGVCNVFEPLQSTFDAKTFYDTPIETNAERYFRRGRSPFDEQLFKNAMEGEHKYIDPHLPNMDVIFNGEMAVENMKNFARGFLDLLTK